MHNLYSIEKFAYEHQRDLLRERSAIRAAKRNGNASQGTGRWIRNAVSTLRGVLGAPVPRTNTMTGRGHEAGCEA